MKHCTLGWGALWGQVHFGIRCTPHLQAEIRSKPTELGLIGTRDSILGCGQGHILSPNHKVLVIYYFLLLICGDGPKGI
jgi:hypothetical protein